MLDDLPSSTDEQADHLIEFEQISGDVHTSVDSSSTLQLKEGEVVHLKPQGSRAGSIRQLFDSRIFELVENEAEGTFLRVKEGSSSLGGMIQFSYSYGPVTQIHVAVD